MAQATLNATVVLGGRVDNSFTQMGDALYTVGSMVNGVSKVLLDFGKESIEVYRNYEDSMLDAQVALSTTYGRGTRELHDVMSQLDAQATEWAASSIFHTNDVGNAIAQAAHANWDLEMILDGIPAAMHLAQAGSLDLSQAIDYIVKSTNAMGIEFQNVGQFIDEWVYSANSSAGSVETFGDAMVKMGKTMSFADSQQELLSMIAILHDAGATGTEAGTLLRNTMIRIVAPTKKAQEAMAQLGITQADIEEAMGEVDGNTVAAMESLEKYGFTAYDQAGNLKSYLDIFRDLALTTDKMTEQERNDVLSALFPTRTITGALALLDELRDGTSQLYEDLVSGRAEGYGKYGADTMMSGLTGAIETLASKYERLHQAVGGSLAEDVENVSGALGGFLDWVNGFDAPLFDGIVGGLEVIAGAGPALMAAGIGMKAIGIAWDAFTKIPGGKAIAPLIFGAIAVGALTNAIQHYNETEFEDKFGDLHLDPQPIRDYLNNLSKPLNNATQDMRDFQSAAKEAVDRYKELSQQLSADLITSMITGQEIDDKKQKELLGLGESMGEAVVNGISNAYDADLQATLVAAGGDESNPMFAQFMAMMDSGYASAIEKANSLSKQLREAMQSAFSDGILTDNELDNMREYLNQLNDLVVAETEAAEFAERQRVMRKLQGMSLDSMNEITDTINEYRDAQVGTWEAMRNDTFRQLDMGYSRGDISKEDYENQIAYWGDVYGRHISDVDMDADSMLLRTMNNAVKTSEFGYMQEALEPYVRQAMENYGSPEALRLARENAQRDLVNTGAFGLPDWGKSSDWNGLRDSYEIMIDKLGGMDEVMQRLASAEESGNTDAANLYRNMLGMYQLLTGDESRTQEVAQSVQAQAEASPESISVESVQSLLDGPIRLTWAAFMDNLEHQDETIVTPFELYGLMTEEAKQAMNAAVLELGNTFDLDRVISDLMPKGADFGQFAQQWAAWQLMYNMPTEQAEQYRTQPVVKDEPIGDNNVSLPSPEELNPQPTQQPYTVPLGQSTMPPWFDGWISQQPFTAPLEPVPATSLGDISAAFEASAGALTQSAQAISQVAAQQPQAQETARTPYTVGLDGVATGTPYTFPLKLNTEDAGAAKAEAEAVFGEGIEVAVTFPDAGSSAGTARSEVESTLGSDVDVGVSFPNAVSAASSAHSAMAAQFSPITQYVNIVTSGGGGTAPKMAMKAEGGRATEPVIFGEAGPEWFIPEEKTRRTASLLVQAASASGFTLADLAMMSGARAFADGGVVGDSESSTFASDVLPTLSWDDLTPASSGDSGSGSGSDSSGIQIEYSPVIHADNADGVERVLNQDKEHLKALLLEIMEQRDLMESVSVYR